ncbi:hypothetical protein B0H63DRAFT_36340 [Podospora didyma]|uniref:Altered inheritance of mitochondria protein 11 n=1 Tax=Podospora didyma TaxID=330526 RepID=A0AAE0U7X0_9PEZI|nr:hypothetical protein B0H63DRAFT_36340 [Podospora didyma]
MIFSSIASWLNPKPTPAPIPTPAAMRLDDPPRAPVPVIETPPQQQQQTYYDRQPTPFFSSRSMRQLGLYFGGVGFVALSVMVSRRAVTRHMKLAKIRYFQPNLHTGTKANGAPEIGGRDPFIPVEALGLATLNVISAAIMVAGGITWAFDISSVDDLRAMARRSMELQGGFTDTEAEREVTEWVASMLGGDSKDEKTTSEAEPEKS